jgi:type IV pilus assembly protein PilW
MRNPRAATRTVTRRKVRGLSLIELMIALVLGLVVVGAAGGVFLANRRVYAASETLNRVQENGRVSFELIARDLREAGGTPCGVPFWLLGRDEGFVNMLDRAPGDWTQNLFMDGIRGTEAGDRDSVDIFRSGDRGMRTITGPIGPASVIDVDDVAGIEAGDLVVACNSEVAILFEVQDTPADKKVRFNGGRNCGTKLLTRPVGPNCVGAEPSNKSNGPYCFHIGAGGCFDGPSEMYKDGSGKPVYPPARLVRIGGVRWYVAANNRGGTSLYRATLNSAKGSGAIPGANPEEIAEGVSRLQLRYRRADAQALGFRPANEVPADGWARVNAVEVAITTVGVAGNLSANDIQGTDPAPLERTFTYVVALRNREDGA